MELRVLNSLFKDFSSNAVIINNDDYVNKQKLMLNIMYAK